MLAATLSFVTYTGTAHAFNVAVIFASFSLFQLLRQPLMFLPRALSATTDAQTALARLAARGLLRVDDPAVAAEQFTWLVLAAPLNRLTLTGGRTGGTQEESDAVADEAVATFLARYAPRGAGD